MNMPADWAIEEAIKAAKSWGNKNPWTAEYIKGHEEFPFSEVILQLARMIEKYEPHRKPIDPALVIVRELWASHFKFIGGTDIAAQEYRDGHYDSQSTFQAFLAKYKELHP